MNKILSICIPSYNMEEYLHRCVDSMIVEEVLDKLEIIIVNDGSKDGTLAIANSYKERYPQSVVMVDKPNGHYGSCINASLKVAKGKYFRIVDADDWVDSVALVQVVNRLSEVDVDCFGAKFTYNYPNSKDTEQMDVPYNVVLDLNEFVVPMECLHMHVLIYSTDLLRRIDYTQSEGICYTDMEYVYIPLSCSKTIYFMDVSLYQYLVGREGQSVDFNVIVRNNDHYLKMLSKIDSAHNSNLPFNKEEPDIFSRIIQYVLLTKALPNYILYHRYDKKKELLFRKLYDELARTDQLKFPSYISNNKIRMMDIWHKSGNLSKYLMWLFRLYNKFFAAK